MLSIKLIASNINLKNEGNETLKKKKDEYKKNRIENGKRGDFSGSNPHSKGEDFSWSSLVFIEIVEASKLKMFAIMIDRKAEIIEILIFCSLNKDLLIGS